MMNDIKHAYACMIKELQREIQTEIHKKNFI